MRVVIGVEYDGSHFQGFQSQRGLRTVQLELEGALSQIADESIKVVCSGRTDAGVHALGQVVHFDTNVSRNNRAWLVGTNSYLPEDVIIKWVYIADESFHARFSAHSRHYRYIINDRSIRLALLRYYVTYWGRPLNEVLMRTAAKVLLGEHDFSSFRGADCQSKTVVRRVDVIDIHRQQDFLMIDIVANAFLHHMVRNIIGVLLKIGMGKKAPSWMSEVLAACDRKVGSITAPSQGLYLVDVKYPKVFRLPVDKQSTHFFNFLFNRMK